jgi:hypothetical protein
MSQIIKENIDLVAKLMKISKNRAKDLFKQNAVDLIRGIGTVNLNFLPIKPREGDTIRIGKGHFFKL